MPELEPRRKRNILHGCTVHVWAENEGEGSFHAAPHAPPPDADPEAQPGSPSPAGVAARIGARRRPEVAARLASTPMEMGHFDVDMYPPPRFQP